MPPRLSLVTGRVVGRKAWAVAVRGFLARGGGAVGVVVRLKTAANAHVVTTWDAFCPAPRDPGTAEAEWLYARQTKLPGTRLLSQIARCAARDPCPAPAALVEVSQLAPRTRRATGGHTAWRWRPSAGTPGVAAERSIKPVAAARATRRMVLMREITKRLLRLTPFVTLDGADRRSARRHHR